MNTTAVAGSTAVASARVDIRLTAGVDTRDPLGAIRSCLGGLDGIEITDVSWTRGSYEPLDAPLVEASTNAAEAVVDGPVFRRSATGGGDAKALRHEGVPTVEFGFGTQTAHGTDEYTTTDALARNVTAYALLPYEYGRRVADSARLLTDAVPTRRRDCQSVEADGELCRRGRFDRSEAYISISCSSLACSSRSSSVSNV